MTAHQLPQTHRLAKLAFAAAAIFSAQCAHATGIVEALVIVQLKDLSIEVIKLAYHQVFDDNRGAIAFAAVESGSVVKTDVGTWFGSAGPVTADIADNYGSAHAMALNSLGSKVVDASGGGVFYSEALLTWKGEVKLSKVASSLALDSTTLASKDMPTPDQVASAKLQLQYVVNMDVHNDIGSNDKDHHGSWSTSISIDQKPVFVGQVTSTLNGLPVFHGDLMPFASQFDTGLTHFTGKGLALGGSYSRSIDYDAFYSSPEVTVGLSGSDHDLAQGVPEPTTWAMVLTGFGVLWMMRRKSKAAARYTV